MFCSFPFFRSSIFAYFFFFYSFTGIHFSCRLFFFGENKKPQTYVIPWLAHPWTFVRLLNIITEHISSPQSLNAETQREAFPKAEFLLIASFNSIFPSGEILTCPTLTSYTKYSNNISYFFLFLLFTQFRIYIVLHPPIIAYVHRNVCFLFSQNGSWRDLITSKALT